MKTQPLESSIMLAGLTRGLWTGAPADRNVDGRDKLADAASWRSVLLSDDEMPRIAGADRAADSAVTTSDCG